MPGRRRVPDGRRSRSRSGSQELAQPGEAHGIDDLPAVARGMDEARLLERGEVKGEGRRRHSRAAAAISPAAIPDAPRDANRRTSLSRVSWASTPKPVAASLVSIVIE